MKLLHGSGIKQALREIAPRQVAVAYAGKDWRDYLSTDHLQEIILSPTIGSNPFAISALVSQLGWERVHFLDNLHTKLYLGKGAAALGSFNLTANGLSAEGLEEAGYLVQEDKAIEELRQLFDSYLAKAHENYPSVEEKASRLTALYQLWGRAIRADIIRNDGQDQSLTAFLPFAENIYICGVTGECEYNEEVVDSSIIRDSVCFMPRDDIERGKWVLCWHADDNGYPRDETEPYWVHIDEIIEHGVKDTEYSKLAIELKTRSAISPPFELTPIVVAAVHATLRLKRFVKFLWLKDPWRIAPTLPLMPAFLAEVERQMRKPETHPAPEATDLDSIRQEFDALVRRNMEIAHSNGWISALILTLLAEANAVEVARRLIKPSRARETTRDELREGLKSLAKENALELSLEHTMVEERYKPLFTRAELEAAHANLYQVNSEYWRTI
ncbi:phospholipase D family protein [Pseudomonas sp. zfem004]|uniref:phospholipase D family protein n=1 Tax=Pseudomonas sp. zfem004 TaxID=3078199 RepID=UPI002929B893|nr:phospholipase D family protein [Pseudomonas sp. zfem004]MDU9404989.1 phospholipase D family protein [Pseudomonas sp. zfem004]